MAKHDPGYGQGRSKNWEWAKLSAVKLGGALETDE